MVTDCMFSEMDQRSCRKSEANRRRFNEEQTKYLEFMFEAESRPESQMKEQVASELGLEPRQVSIWFQNRRARLKTKQIEREYNELRASYNALASSFESMQKENQALLVKLQQLKQRMQHKNENGDQKHSTNWEKSKTMHHTNSESKEDNGNSFIDNRGKEDMFSTNQDNTKAESTREEAELLNLTRYNDSSMASSDWNNFESTTFLNESSSSSQWWEF